MKTINLILVLAATLNIILASCDKDPCCIDEPADNILKFKNGKDYSKNVFVQLSDDKKSVNGHPGYKGMIDIEPLDFYKGYYLELPNYGILTGYLSLTIEEYKNVPDTFNKVAIEDLIIDKDPYEEYYYDEDKYLKNDCPECLDKDTIWHAIDTAKFHRLVDNGELGKYLKRVKYLQNQEPMYSLLPVIIYI